MKRRAEVILSRRIDTQTLAMMLTVKEFDTHDEILAVLKLFNAHNQITIETVNKELLFMPPDSPYGQNVLRAVEEYGLIKEKREGIFDLTPVGKDAMEREGIPIPKKGVYRVVISDDPLLQYKVLDIQPMESQEDKSRISNSEMDLPETVIKIFEGDMNRTIELALSDLRSVIIEDFGHLGYVLRTSSNPRISLRLTTDGDVSLKLTERKEISLKPPEEFKWFDILEQILSGSGSLKMVDDTEVLLIETEGLTVNEIRSFSKSFKIGKPSIRRYGDFDPLMIQNMRIMPSNEQQAMLWASKLLLTNIDRYVGEPEYNAIAEETAGSFEPLYSESLIRGNLPSFSEVIRKTRERYEQYREAYWYLMAPYDLSPARGDNIEN